MGYKRPKTETVVCSQEGAELYLSNFDLLIDEFISNRLNNNSDLLYINCTNQIFNQLLYYISDNLPKINYDDIYLLNTVFDKYIKLSSFCNIAPSLGQFAELCKISPKTFREWEKGGGQARVKPALRNFVQNWRLRCGEKLQDKIINSGGNPVGGIFILKSVYGLSDQPQALQVIESAKEINELPQLSQNCIAESLGNSESG